MTVQQFIVSLLQTDTATRRELLSTYLDTHRAETEADADDGIYGVARETLQMLRAYVQTDDDLDSEEILTLAQTLYDIDSFILDNSR